MSLTIREIGLRSEAFGEDSLLLRPVIEKYIIKEDETATRILSALEYATGDTMGLYGSQKSLFALRCCYTTYLVRVHYGRKLPKCMTA